MRFPEALDCLRHPGFRRYWLGQTASRLGTGLVPLATVFAVLKVSGSAVDVGLVLAAGTAAEVIALGAGGVWSDRFSRRTVMIAADSVRAVIQLATFALLLSGSARLWHLAALTFLQSLAGGLFRPASVGLMPALVEATGLRQANSLLSITGSAAAIAGPSLAGLMVALVDVSWAFAFDGLTYVISIVTLVGLGSIAPIGMAKQRFVADLREGWREVTSRRWVWVQILWDASNAVLVFAPFLVLGPLIAQQSLGGAAAWGVILACYPIGAVLGGLIALRWQPRYPLRTVAIVLPLGLGAPSAMLALGQPILVVAIAEICSGAVVALTGTYWTTVLQQHIPLDRLARVSANDSIASFALLPLGYAIAGPLGTRFGMEFTLGVSAIWIVLSAMLVLAVRETRNLTFIQQAEEGSNHPRSVSARVGGEAG